MENGSFPRKIRPKQTKVSSYKISKFYQIVEIIFIPTGYLAASGLLSERKIIWNNFRNPQLPNWTLWWIAKWTWFKQRTRCPYGRKEEEFNTTERFGKHFIKFIMCVSHWCPVSKRTGAHPHSLQNSRREGASSLHPLKAQGLKCQPAGPPLMRWMEREDPSQQLMGKPKMPGSPCTYLHKYSEGGQQREVVPWDPRGSSAGDLLSPAPGDKKCLSSQEDVNFPQKSYLVGISERSDGLLKR